MSTTMPRTDHRVQIFVDGVPYGDWTVGHDVAYYPSTIYGNIASIDIRSVRTGDTVFERVSARQYQSYARELQILVAMLEGKKHRAEDIITEEMMGYDAVHHFGMSAIDLVSLTAKRMEELRPSDFASELRCPDE